MELYFIYRCSEHSCWWRNQCCWFTLRMFELQEASGSQERRPHSRNRESEIFHSYTIEAVNAALCFPSSILELLTGTLKRNICIYNFTLLNNTGVDLYWCTIYLNVIAFVEKPLLKNNGRQPIKSVSEPLMFFWKHLLYAKTRKCTSFSFKRGLI